MRAAESRAIELAGIDGRNPLAFLAALGALRLLSMNSVLEPRLSWGMAGNAVPHPRIQGRGLDTKEDLLERLVEAHVNRDLEAEFGWGADVMKVDRDRVRGLTSVGETGLTQEILHSLVAELPLRQSGDAPYTPFRLLPRVGRSRLLQASLKVSTVVSPHDFHHALFEHWRYRKSPGSNSLRLDPGARLSARAYAAEAPTNFGPLGVPGAIALGVVGLTFFPLQPMRRDATCRGFAAGRGQFHWPIWSDPLSLLAARLLLGLPELYVAQPDPHTLARHGVTARVTSRRERRGSDDEVLTWGKIDVHGTLEGEPTQA